MANDRCVLLLQSVLCHCFVSSLCSGFQVRAAASMCDLFRNRAGRSFGSNQLFGREARARILVRTVRTGTVRVPVPVVCTRFVVVIVSRVSRSCLRGSWRTRLPSARHETPRRTTEGSRCSSQWNGKYDESILDTFTCSARARQNGRVYRSTSNHAPPNMNGILDSQKKHRHD